jgi:hypothetical protein
MYRAVGPAKGDIAGLDGDFTHPGNGVPGIDKEIGQQLIDLGRIDLYRPELCPGVPEQVDILTDQPLEHIEHVFEF